MFFESNAQKKSVSRSTEHSQLVLLFARRWNPPTAWHRLTTVNWPPSDSIVLWCLSSWSCLCWSSRCQGDRQSTKSLHRTDVEIFDSSMWEGEIWFLFFSPFHSSTSHQYISQSVHSKRAFETEENQRRESLSFKNTVWFFRTPILFIRSHLRWSERLSGLFIMVMEEWHLSHTHSFTWLMDHGTVETTEKGERIIDVDDSDRQETSGISTVDPENGFILCRTFSNYSRAMIDHHRVLRRCGADRRARICCEMSLRKIVRVSLDNLSKAASTGEQQPEMIMVTLR